jgi:hypothetical protein
MFFLKKKLPPPPPAQELVDKIVIYLETSGSMAGYYRGKTTFKDKMPNVLQGIKTISRDSNFIASPQNQQENFTVARIHEKIYPYKAGDFAAILSNFNESIVDGSSSEIQKMLAAIINANSPNGISVFVSDCILSYPADRVKKDANININQIGGLQALLKESFTNTNTFAASVFAFNSEFNGYYYTCKNIKIDYNYDVNKPKKYPEKRPYYIWVIGKPALLARFNQKLKQITDFMPQQELHFGLANATTSPSKCFIVRDVLKNAQLDKNNPLYIKEIDKDSKELSFTIGLNLAKYALPEGEIKNLLKVSSIDATISIVNVESKEIFKTRAKLIFPQTKQEVENYSHFITIKAGSLAKKTEIQISLPVRTATWYHEWSVDDDSQTETNVEVRKRTFAFKYMIQAMDEVFNPKRENEAAKIHFSHKITLFKK